MTDIRTVEEALQHPERFRVSIFGSARIKKDSVEYQKVFNLAKRLGKLGINIVTGGGPGIMEAANSGLKAGTNGDAKSVGLTVDLPWETEGNDHLDISKHFRRFSNRLDHFMALSNVVVVMPGGIGTCLELFYTWQLVQVEHICEIPIILADDMWHTLYSWVKKDLLGQGLVSEPDLKPIFCTSTNEETFEIIEFAYREFKKEGSKFCLNIDKYQP